MPVSALADSKIIDADSMALITGSNKNISGYILTREKEKLPEDYDLAGYPECILAGNDEQCPDSDEFSELIKNTRCYIDTQYGKDSLIVKNIGAIKVFKVGDLDDSWYWVVAEKNSFEILSLTTRGFDMEDIMKILEGDNNAD